MWLLLLCGVLLNPDCLAEAQLPTWRWPETQGAASRLSLAAGQPSTPRPGVEPVASHAVEVECGPDRVLVRVHGDLFGAGKLVDPADLTLGVLACPPVSWDAEANVVLFEAGLHECGSIVQVTPDLLVYQMSLFYKPSLATNSVVARTNAAVIPFECHYPRSGDVASPAVKPTWASFSSTASVEGRLGFSLRLMNEDWSADRPSTSFQLGGAMHLQAEVHSEKHLPLRVFVDGCVASVSPEPSLGPQYAMIDANGCLVDGMDASVSSTFLFPRPRQDTLRFTIDAFHFAGDPRKMIYITCHLKVIPVTQDPDVLNKACSFDTASNSWFPVEGPENICSCCEMRNCDRMLEEQLQDPGPGHQPLEMNWQRSPPAESAVPQAHLGLGPLFIFDSEDSLKQFPGDTADAEGASAEELMPSTESEADATGTPVPFEEQKMPADISREPEDRPEPPLEVYVRGGPIFLSGAEDGSGFEEQAEPARSAEESLALELKAQLTSRPAEEAAPSAGKVPVEAIDLREKGPEKKFSMVLFLLLLMAAATVTFLALGGLILVKRCRRRHSMLSASQLSM